MDILQIHRGLFCHEATPEHTHDRAALEQRKIEGNTGDGATGETDHQVAPVPGHAAQGGFGIVTTHRVIHNIHTLAAGELLQGILE